MALSGSFFSFDHLRNAWSSLTEGRGAAQGLRRGSSLMSSRTVLEQSEASRYGAASLVELTPQARSLIATLTEIRERTETAAKAKTQADKTPQKPVDFAARAEKLLSTREAVPMGKAADSLFRDAKGPEVDEVRQRLDKLVGRMTPPLTEVKAPPGRRRGTEGAFFMVTDANMRMLRMEARQEGGREVLRVVYSGHDLGSVDMTVERSGSGDQATLKADYLQRAILPTGRIDTVRPPVEEAHYEAPVRPAPAAEDPAA